jgi:hypothetical protein
MLYPSRPGTDKAMFAGDPSRTSPVQMRRVAVITAVLLLAACGGTKAKSAQARDDPVAPLGIRSDGTLDPDHINLSGIAGVTPAEQASAERLLRRTILALARWTNVAQATSDGFVAIGDGFTGTEHYIHWDWIDDNAVLDPSRPESLMYRLGPNGQRTLEGAMYILPKRFRFTNAPDAGGALVQFHSHYNECFSGFPAPKFRAVTRTDGSCPAGLTKLLTNLMLHVWIRPNPCGPFAPVGGFASGTIKAGEKVLCDRVHGGTP